MAKKQKLTKEELENLQQQIQQLNAYKLTIGDLQDKVFSYSLELHQAKSQHQAFLAGIEQKYGQVNIDPKTGDLTPNS